MSGKGLLKDIEDFEYSVTSEAIRAELLDSISGTGAFRHFKSTIRRRGIEQAWFAFHAKALREIAVAWCEKNGVEWT